MYKSPITIIESTIDSFTKSIIKQKDDAIFAEIQHSFGVDVEKEELIRALQYDRNQYEKGYADGKADAAPKWIPVTESLPNLYETVIVCDVREQYVGAWMYYGNGDWLHDDKLFDTEDITHWMPLPEAPKEGE